MRKNWQKPVCVIGKTEDKGKIMKPFRIGLYGCGGRTMQIVEKAVKEGRAKITLCYDINKEHAEHHAALYGARVCSKQELLESKECDMLLIALFPAAHPEALLESIPSGKPIYIEKPIAVTINDIVKLLPLLGKGYVHVGCSYHYFPVFRTIENLVKSGKVGKIISMHIDSMGNTDMHSNVWGGKQPNWRGRPETGGELTQHGTHKFEFMRRLCGDFRSVAAQSLKRSDNPSNIEDLWELIMTQGEDTQTSLRYSFRNSIFREGGYIEGEKGTIEYIWSNPSILNLYESSFTKKDPVSIPLVENLGPEDQLDDFIERYKNGLRPDVDLEDGIWSILPPIYARESAATGKTIAFPKKLTDLLPQQI